MASDLSALRARLDVLDRELMHIAAQRAAIVGEIAQAKAGEGKPLFDRERERKVFEKARATGADFGLPEEVSQGLMRVLVEASHRIQEDASRAAAADAVLQHSFTLVGGRGQMGRLLAGAFEARGHAVTVLDKGDDVLGSDAVRTSDIVMVCVPMAAAVEMVHALGPLVRHDALLVDINSLKTDVCAAMEAGEAGEALGLHPMFGPSVRSLRRQKVVVCPVRRGPLGDWLCAELGQMGMELIETEPVTHDRMMAVVQVLVHFSTLVMGEALRRSGFSVEETLRYTSPIYRLEMAFCGRLFTQDSDLYAEIEMANPHGPAVRQSFLDAAAHVEEAVQRGDREHFRQLFGGVTEYFSDFGGEAMALSDLIIELLVSQP